MRGLDRERGVVFAGWCCRGQRWRRSINVIGQGERLLSNQQWTLPNGALFAWGVGCGSRCGGGEQGLA